MLCGLRDLSPRIQNNFRALVLLVAEDFIHLRRLIDGHAMAHHKTGIDLPVLDFLEQWLHVTHHVRLPRLHGESLIHERAQGDLVIEPRVHARNRNRPTLTTGLNRLSKYIRAVGLDAGLLLYAVHHVDHSVAMRFHADCVDAAVRTDVPRHILQGLHHVIHFFIVDGFGAAFFRHAQAVVEAVDGDHAFRAQHECRAYAELPDRAASPDGYGVALFNVGILRAEVACRENIR